MINLYADALRKAREYALNISKAMRHAAISGNSVYSTAKAVEGASGLQDRVQEDISNPFLMLAEPEGVKKLGQSMDELKKTLDNLALRLDQRGEVNSTSYATSAQQKGKELYVNQ